MYLKAKGYEVVTAENGLDGQEKLGSTAVNLIMSDINMPYMDGIEFVKNVRANPVWMHIPILMVSTEADAEEKQKAFSAGANDYLVKPVTAEMVTSTIKKMLKEIFSKGGQADA